MEVATPGPDVTTFPFDIMRSADRQKKSTILTSVKPYLRTYHLFGFGWREIHSSERRKPSEVSCVSGWSCHQWRTVTLRI
jgi:hypothetical protein